MTDNEPAMSDSHLAAYLLAIDPAGLGGAVIAGPPGPERDAWLALLIASIPPDAPVKRLPAFIADDRLLGGLDLAATLSLKRPVIQRGLLAEADGGLVIAPSAERLDSATAARLAGALSRGEIVLERDGAALRLPTRFALIAFDESAEPEEAFPEAIAGLCAFLIDTRVPSPPAETADCNVARARLAHLAPVSPEIIAGLAGLAVALGIASLGPVRLAMRAASAHAALAGRDAVTADDAAAAARLVLAPRATMLPADAEEPAAEEPPDRATDAPPPTDGDSNDSPADRPLEDILRESVATSLPPGLLEQAKAANPARGPAARAAGGGGRIQKSPLRGRPLGARSGALRPGARLALVDTLRAAAPWQTVRKVDRSDAAARIEVRPSDFRIRRFAERREATIVFCVDASGSAAFHRLAEAKGAVELLLAEAYVARTHAALVTFRDRAAETVLPPTRSLARAHALLADLPGGGGTPLALGLDAALAVARGERARGRDPTIVVLTDGSANIARDGTAMRLKAGEEALAAAAGIAAESIPSVFIDTAPRPRPEGQKLAGAMGARFVQLPYVDAANVGAAVRAATAR